MTITELSTVAPAKPDTDLAGHVAQLLTSAKSNLAALRLRARYETFELPNITKADLGFPTLSGKPDSRPANLHDALYFSTESERQAQARRTNQPVQPQASHGRKLAQEIEAAEAHVAVLEEIKAEQDALAEAYVEWENAQSEDLTVRISVPNSFGAEDVALLRQLVDEHAERIRSAIAEKSAEAAA